MKWTPVDYRGLSWAARKEPRFRHIWLLLFWPLFGLLFLAVELSWPGRSYIEVSCALDELIPFCEWFLIPYLFWFVYLIGMMAYGFFFDVENFTRMMKYVIITYSVTMVIYLLFPTMQTLRPVEFPRDNLLTTLAGMVYAFDTNTNVCPSIHVLGSFAAMYAGWNSRHFSAKPWRIAFAVVCVLICVSTLFMKQHSAVDVITALPIALAAYPIAFGCREKRHSQRRAYALCAAAEPL